MGLDLPLYLLLLIIQIYIIHNTLFAGNRMRNTYLRIIASNKTVICSEAIFRQVQLPCSRYKDNH